MRSDALRAQVQETGEEMEKPSRDHIMNGSACAAEELQNSSSRQGGTVASRDYILTCNGPCCYGQKAESGSVTWRAAILQRKKNWVAF